MCLETVGQYSIGKDVQVRIEKIHQPWTLSCVMEVSFSSSGANPTKVFLKLYDWRYAAQLRKDNRIDPWTEKHETAYIDFVRSGQAEDFLDKFRNDDDFEEPEEGWNVPENETYLYDLCVDMFHAETTVYEKLHEYQGKQIPRMIAPVSYGIGISNERSSDDYDNTRNGPSSADSFSPNVDQIDSKAPKTELFKIHGILIELIEGFTLADINEHAAPKSAWQSIVDQAIQNVGILSDNEILNGDVRASNILIFPKSNGTYRVCMIDFAQCRIREDESDREWGRAKWSQDEEGAVGYVMKSRLAKQGFELEYVPSLRYLEWAQGENDPDG